MVIASLRKNIFFASLASFIGLVLLVFFIEAFFWMLSLYKDIKNPEIRMGTDATEFDSKLGWTPIKNAKYVYAGLNISINSLGLRSPEVDFSKEHILIVGDSVTFGVGVSDDETFPYFLENRLKKKYKNIQVLNLGVPGYGMGQYFLRLKHYIGNLKPKIIIILVCSRNDLADSSSENPYGKKKPYFTLKGGVLKQSNKDISYFNCENIFSKSWFLKKSFFASFRKPICQTKSQNRKQTIEVVKALVGKIKDLANNYESKVLFATVPQRDVFILKYCATRSNLSFCKKRKKAMKKNIFKVIQKEKEKKLGKYAKEVAGLLGGYNRGRFDFMEFQKLFTTTQSNHLDISYSFLKIGFPIEKFDDLFVDEVHFSPKGSSVLAQVFEKYLETNHWMEPRV